MKDLFVGRQPILDEFGQLYAFELLYRDGKTNAFPNIDPSLATIQVIVNTYMSPGFEQIAAKKTFINFSERLLFSPIFTTLNPNAVVIEILESVKMTRALLNRLKELKSQGFKFALDDFVLEEELKDYPDLFRVIHYIKVDFLATTQEQRAIIEGLKQQFPHVKLLAEKVETKEQFEQAKKDGYELFQGYYFAKPEIVQGSRIPASMPVYFELLRLLNRKNINIEDITKLAMSDVGLTYKLLKYANKYAYQSIYKIKSVKQAIVRIGIDEFKKWLLFLIIYQKGDNKEATGWVKTIVNFSLVRANICEQLAIAKGKMNVDDYYMLGLFSMFDLIIRKESNEAFSLLPISEDVIETLKGENTAMKPYLEIAKSLEALEFKRATDHAEEISIGYEQLNEIAMQAANLENREYPSKKK